MPNSPHLAKRKYARSCDISKFYNKLRLDEDHYNLATSDVSETFALVRHFYGISSTAGLMKAVMQDDAQAADALGLHDVTDAIRAAFVDDVSTSLDDVWKLQQLKTDLMDFFHARSRPIKEFALTGTRPD